MFQVKSTKVVVCGFHVGNNICLPAQNRTDKISITSEIYKGREMCKVFTLVSLDCQLSLSLSLSLSLYIYIYIYIYI
jgi:hypothetical protein